MSENTLNASGKWLPSNKVMGAAQKVIDRILELRIEKSEKIITDLMKQKDGWFIKAPKTREAALAIINSEHRYTYTYYEYKDNFANKQLILCRHLISLCKIDPNQNIFITITDFAAIHRYYDNETIMIRNN